MDLTEEQTAIRNRYLTTKENLLITARAGAAKTTTLHLLASETSQPALFLAFNRSIANEAKNKMPPNVRAMTLNGIGHLTLVKALPKRIDLDKNKVYNLLKERLDRGKKMSELLRAVRIAKQQGFLPGSKKSLTTAEDFYQNLDLNLGPRDQEIVNEVLTESYELATRGVIDFDDQLLVPTLERLAFPDYRVIFVDEAQDLSWINHRMIQLIKGFGSRIIAVGDDAQAIYGFRGADEQSMPRMKEMFNMQDMKLTMTFRCSRSVTRHANWLTGDLRHRPDAPEGSVQHHENLTYHDMPPRCAILCRNNAPIIRLTLRMMKAGLAPKLIGRDILNETVKELAKISRVCGTKAAALEAVDKWEKEKKRTWKNRTLVEDRADCIRAFLEPTANPRQALNKVRELIAIQRGNITLSTIHKAKGSEYDNVIIVDKDLIGLFADKQEDNLLYVAQTRAKENLSYVPSLHLGA